MAQGVDLETTLTGTETGLVQTNLGDYEGSQYSFLVELVTYSAEGSVVKSDWMKEFSYDDLVTGGFFPNDHPDKSAFELGEPLGKVLIDSETFGADASVTAPDMGMIFIVR